MLALKSGLRFFVSAPEVLFFVTWKRALLAKVPVFKCQKMGLLLPKQKDGDHFLMPTSPQNGELPVCFMRLPLLGRQHYRLSICNYFEKSRLVYFWVGFKPIFENRVLEPFRSHFYTLKKPKSGFVRYGGQNQRNQLFFFCKCLKIYHDIRICSKMMVSTNLANVYPPPNLRLDKVAQWRRATTKAWCCQTKQRCPQLSFSWVAPTLFLRTEYWSHQRTRKG